ncbi:MAG TPA: glycosyltransferase [Candidatus Angelobacter sp.]|nr:glycosyltransferase [Candidatus Angelobacter sp.]
MQPRVPREYPLAVVIPTYNRAATLISCLEHLERQSWTDFEVVVVDDGSSDQTPQKFQEYSQRTTLNLRYLRQPNGGPASARNAAISVVHSPIVLMIGDDIFATPELVESHLNLHRRRSELHVAGLGLTEWETETQTLTRFMKFLDEVQFSYSELMQGKQPTWMHFYTSNVSVKTEALRRNLFDEDFRVFEDIELGLRMARTEGLDVVFIPNALAYHYHPATFLQACHRMKTVGWSAHLFHERWPEAYMNPVGRTAVRRAVRRFLACPPFLYLATQSAALASRFITPKKLFRAVLYTHSYVGYRKRESQEQKARGVSNPQANAGSALRFNRSTAREKVLVRPDFPGQ